MFINDELTQLTPRSTARRRRVGWNALLAATLAPISLLHGTERRKDSLILTPDLPTAPSQKVENCTELTPCPQGLQHKTLTPAALNQNAEINSAAGYCTEPDGTEPEMALNQKAEMNSVADYWTEPDGTKREAGTEIKC